MQESSKNTTFKYYIPASDSIFITSEVENVNLFFKQLSYFLLRSYTFTSNRYENPIDEKEATKGEIVSFNSTTKSLEIKEATYSPCLFRGGVSKGVCEPLQQLRIIKNKMRNDCCNLVGQAVANAVHLEGIVKGPRIVVEENVYNLCDDDLKRHYFRQLEETELIENTDSAYYELLWPVAEFIRLNGIQLEMRKLDALVKGVYNLWKSKSNEGAQKHYEAYMDLIYNSIGAYWEDDEKAKTHIDKLKNTYKIEMPR